MISKNPHSWMSLAAMAAVVGCSALFSGCGQSSSAPPQTNPSTVEAMRSVLGGSGETVAKTPATKFQHSGGFVALKGRVKFNGAPPARKAEPVDKDTAVCAPGGTPLSERILVGADGGVAYVAIYLETEPGRDVPVHESAQKPDPARSTVFDQKACAFVPRVFAIHTGAKAVTLKNSDSVPHNTNITAANNDSANPTLPPLTTATYQLKADPLKAEESSPITVTCAIHTWMKGYMLPRSNGYFAVTGADGRFEIANLPTGDRLSLVVWHEAANGRGGSMRKMKLNVPTAKVGKRGGIELTLEKDKPLDLEIEVDETTFK